MRSPEEEALESKVAARVNYDFRQLMRQVLDTRAGRVVFASILEVTGVDASTPTGNSPETHVAIGMRDAGLAVLDLMGEIDDPFSMRGRMARELAALRRDARARVVTESQGGAPAAPSDEPTVTNTP